MSWRPNILLLGFLVCATALPLGWLLTSSGAEDVVRPAAFLAVFAAVVIVGRARRMEFIGPGMLLVLSWMLSFAFGNLELWRSGGNQTDPWAWSTWWYFLGAILAFLSGVWFARDRRGYRLDRQQVRRSLETSVDWRRLTLITYGMYALGFATWLYFSLRLRAATGVAAPILSEDTASARLSFKLPIYGYLYTLLVPAVALSVMNYILHGRRHHQTALLAMAPVAIVAMSSAGVRSDSIRALIVTAILASLLWQPRLRSVVMTAGAVILVFTLVNLARLGSASVDERLLPNRITTIDNRELATLYIYLATPHNNLQAFVESEPEQRNGGVMGRSVFLLVGMDHLSELTEQPEWDVGNTMTWVGSYYQDFGAIGVVGLPFAVGLVTATAFRRLRARPTLARLLVYAFLAEATIMSIATDRFFESSTVFFVGLSIVVARLASRRTQRLPVDAPAPPASAGALPQSGAR